MMNKNISCNASVLINFFRINRTDLLQKCSHSFFITDHVQDEITAYYASQRACLEFALDQKIVKIINVSTPEEFETFKNLSKTRQLGAGECAAIAMATHRGYHLAIDDKQAIKKASSLLPPNVIVRTHDLVLLMIQEELLRIEEADQILQTWATEHRFKLKISSFNELISSSLV